MAQHADIIAVAGRQDFSVYSIPNPHSLEASSWPERNDVRNCVQAVVVAVYIRNFCFFSPLPPALGLLFLLYTLYCIYDTWN